MHGKLRYIQMMIPTARGLGPSIRSASAPQALPEHELLLEENHDALKYGLWLNIAPKTYRLKNLYFEQLGIHVDVPKTLAMVPVALRAQFYPLDHEHFRRIANPGCQDRALGGVLVLELIALPEAPKRVRG